MTMASQQKKLTLGLVIDTEQEKVVYAETSKYGVEFLLNFLRLPLDMEAQAEFSMGCLGNLNESSKNLVRETHLMKPQHAFSILGLGILSGPSFLVDRGMIYAIKDNLEIQVVPCMNLINILDRLKINIKNLNVLRAEVVELGVDEVIKILKASEETNMVLTTVFMEIIRKQCKEYESLYLYSSQDKAHVRKKITIEV